MASSDIHARMPVILATFKAQADKARGSDIVLHECGGLDADGGGFTVPTFRMYDVRGNWFAEGVGVEPEDPQVIGAVAS